MFHSTALFSGTHLAWPVVVLNLGESASLGTGTKMDTLLAVERLLNWLRAWRTDEGTIAQLHTPSKTSKVHFQKVKFQYGEGNRTKHVYVRIWQVFGHSSGKLWAIPQDRSLKANYWNQGVCLEEAKQESVECVDCVYVCSSTLTLISTRLWENFSITLSIHMRGFTCQDRGVTGEQWVCWHLLSHWLPFLTCNLLK